MREIVVPGEKIAEGKSTKAGFGAFKRGDEVFAAVHGLVESDNGFVKVVPLSGKYMPHVGDQVIGIVVMLIGKGCFVNINSAYDGYYSFMRDAQYNVGDLITAEIMEVDEVNSVTLDYAKPLYEGKLIEVASVKIPRIVGKKASMIDILSQGSGCRIFVGRNGRIFITGEDANIRRAEAAIKLIEREAHTTGLTDRVKEFLGKSV
jgi:exosome complex component RRP4